MCFFCDKYLEFVDVKQRSILERRYFSRARFFKSLVKFSTGDILVIIFWVRGLIYRFEGLCICLRKKNFKVPDVSFILRNVLLGVGIEFCVSYFFNRLFFLKISDYKRKRFIYKRAKLYYLRLKLNQASRIK